MGKANILLKSNKLVEVTPIVPSCGHVEVHTNHIIAVNKEQNQIFFESAVWTLTAEDFDNVYKSWVMNA